VEPEVDEPVDVEPEVDDPLLLELVLVDDEVDTLPLDPVLVDVETSPLDPPDEEVLETSAPPVELALDV